MADGPYRTPPPYLTHEQMRTYVRQQLRHQALCWLVVFVAVAGALTVHIWSTGDQQDRLENQESRTHVLWQAVEQTRYDGNASRCRYVAGQAATSSQCARLCLDEPVSVSCRECLFLAGTAMPYEVYSGEDLSLDTLVEALQAVHEVEAALRELEQ